MYQSWGKLLFLHWPVAIETLRPLVPQGLTIDTYEGRAWVALAPFTLWGLRPRFVPPLPGVSRFHELNVRTYVHANGIPGVWFFSLDAARLIPVLGARAFFFLPYYKATMSLREQGPTITYESVRTAEGGAPRASFRAAWTLGDVRPKAVPGSLEFFLVERYCLYAERRGRLYRSRIFHEPWPLRHARLESLESTMMEAAGFAQPSGAPHLLGAGPVDVEVWPLREV